MKRREKKLLWYRGAKFALAALQKSEGNITDEAEELLDIKGMTHIVSGDYWAKGFVDMLKKKAKRPGFLTTQIIKEKDR